MSRYKKDELSAIKLLDLILVNFKNFETTIVSNFEIYKKISANLLTEYTTMQSVESALKKLVKDGYLIENPPKEEELLGQIITTFYYKLSWDGRFFIENGGYNGVILKESAERKRLRDLEVRTQNSNDTMIKLTRWVAGATIVAGAYYLIEIIKFILSFFSHAPSFKV